MMTDEKKTLDNDTAWDLTEAQKPINFSTYDVLDLEGCNLNTYKKITLKKGAEVNMGGIEPLPPEIDASKCAALDLSGRDLSALKKTITMSKGSSFDYNSYLKTGPNINHIPPLQNVDFSRSDKVSISGTDLSNYSKLTFADGATVSLNNCSHLPEKTDLSNCDSVTLCGLDLSQIKDLKFKDGAEVNLHGCTNIPENLDLSRCSSVTIQNIDLNQFKNLEFRNDAAINLSSCTNFPENLDVSHCRAVNLSNTDLSTIKDLKLKDGTHLNLNSCTALPQHVDFDKCNYVDLSNTDLIFRTDIKFKDGAEVNLRQAQNIPDDVDFSTCAKLNLRQCNLGSDCIDGSRSFSFREGAEVSLQQCENLPQNIDFSTCASLCLSSCDLSGQSELNFRDNARVALNGATHIPASTDFSHCQEVWINSSQTNAFDFGNAHVVLSGIGPKSIDVSHLKNATISTQQNDEILGMSVLSLQGTKEFIFKNRTQYEEFLANPNNQHISENISITFADEKKELAMALSKEQGELPKATKADAQNYRIDKAIMRRSADTPVSTQEASSNTLVNRPQENTR